MKMNLSSFLQCRANVFLYLTFGWKIARIFIFLLGRLYFFLSKKEKNRIENAVFEAIGRGNQEADMSKITKKVFSGILCHYYEKMFIAFEKPRRASKFLNQNIMSEDLNVLRKSLLKRKGVIVVTGHYGAIEYIPTLLAINNFPVSMIAKFKTEKLRKKVYSQAEQYKVKLIDADLTQNVVGTAIKELRKNRILVTECDEIEEWRPSERKRVSFLGRIAGLDRTINILQKRTGAEVVFCVIHRFSLSQYRLIMVAHEEMLQILGNIQPASVGETVLKFLEKYIYASPEQWYQWKKYFEIEPSPAMARSVQKPTSPLVLKPAFGGKIS